MGIRGRNPPKLSGLRGITRAVPIYDYTCGACGHAFEYLARTLSDQPAECPECKAVKPSKQLSTFSVAVNAGAPEMPACATGGCSPEGCATGACPYG